MTDLQAALVSRNRQDRVKVLWKLALAVPATLFGILFANALTLPVLYGLELIGLAVPYGTALPIFNVILVIIVVIDVRCHPHEYWHVPRYYQSDGSVKGHEFGSPIPDSQENVLVIAELEHRKGVFGGVPLMTNISDPHNLVERLRVIAAVLANFILGGPRSIARALAVRKQISSRSSRRTVSSAERFISWLKGKGVVAESDVKAHLAAHPDQAEGLHLARELEVVTRRRIQADFHYELR